MKTQMTPLLVLLLAGVTWGDGCGKNQLCVPGWTTAPEDKPTYVVEVTTNAAYDSCEKGKVCINFIGCGKERHSLLADKMGEWAFACHGDKENCAWVYDLAESLNQAHRRRVK